jgi:ubiquinol-cytochrome c reductase cytochrome b subunit
MMATAFMGYVLPWGQMSFWGATVITNLFSAIPVLGEVIVYWLWGGYSVGNATLNRFFSLHYLLPFLIVGLVLVHLTLLHVDGSTNPVGVHKNPENVSFYPYYYVKDMLAFFAFIGVYSYLIFFNPDLLGHPDNYIPANPLVTPAHIVPEWYFLPFYAILRSIPSKLGGVAAMLGSILVLFTLPYTYTALSSKPEHRPCTTMWYWVLVSDFILLGWLGQKPVEEPYDDLGALCTIIYFTIFMIVFPVGGHLDNAMDGKPTDGFHREVGPFYYDVQITEGNGRITGFILYTKTEIDPESLVVEIRETSREEDLRRQQQLKETP